MQPSLVPRPFLYGRGEKGEGRKGLVNNSTPTWIHGISLMFNNCQLRSHEYLQVYRTTLEREAMCPHYTFTQNLFTTHTYLTFAFSLINADGRNAAVDPRWGRLIHQTLPSLAFLAPPIQEGSGNQTMCSPRVSSRQAGRGFGGL